MGGETKEVRRETRMETERDFETDTAWERER